MRSFAFGLSYIGRICLALFFLFSAAQEGADWRGVEQFFFLQINKWLTIYGDPSTSEGCLAWIYPFFSYVVLSLLGLKFLGGFFLIANCFVRIGAFCLLVVFVPTTVLVCDFWHLEGMERVQEIGNFLKSLAVIGGVLLVLAQGKKGISSNTSL